LKGDTKKRRAASNAKLWNDKELHIKSFEACLLRKASRFLLVINILRAFGSQSVRLYDHGIGQMEGIIKGGYRSTVVV